MREAHLVRLLRAAVMAATAAALTWDLALPAGLAAAVAGTLAGVVLGQRLAGSRLRLWAIWAGGLATLGLGLLLAAGVESSVALAGWLGPVGALGAADVLRFGPLFLGAILVVRATAARHQVARTLELGGVVLALVHVLAAHRDGAINRPLFLADWAWSRGIDPVVVLLVLGGAGALLLAVLLLAERRSGRVLVHLGALVLLALLAVLTLRVAGPLQPRAAADPLGLRGKQAERERERRAAAGGAKGQQDRQHDVEEMPFADDYSDEGQQVPVAVVVFRDDYAPPTGIYYFRQTAFSQFNGRRLVATTRADADRDLVAVFPTRETEVAPPAAGPERRALTTVIALMADHKRPFALDYPSRLAPLENPDPLRFRRAYEVTSYVLAAPLDRLLGHRAGARAWSKELWDYYTANPPDPRYARLAGDIVATLPAAYRDDPLAQALAIKLWLDHNGIYSRRSEHAGADDPTGDFLFGDRTGYCVHFAHAAAFLMRARGLPARVGAGYAAPESARGNGSALLLRGGDGHAWPELYLEGVGWVAIDPTPARSLDRALRPPDPGLQRMLGEMAEKGTRPAPPPPAAAGAARSLLARLAAAARAALPWLSVLLLALYAVKAWRRFVPAFARPAALPRVGYRAALDALGEVGLRREYGETREGFARRVLALAPSLAPLTVLHSGAALGSRRGAAPGEVAALCARIGRELGATVPWWRRLLGVLHPLSWVTTT